jgi:Rrf2 family iron-sulfur cluster assembly transcriptional regulator
LCLAQEAGGQPVRAGQIAARLGLPANYLSKILHALTRFGVLESERGPHGGFRLARPPEQLSLAEVMAPFEAIVEQRSCLLGWDPCSDEAPCRLHEQWKRASDPMIEFFNTTMIADLVGQVDLCDGEAKQSNVVSPSSESVSTLNSEGGLKKR